MFIIRSWTLCLFVLFCLSSAYAQDSTRIVSPDSLVQGAYFITQPTQTTFGATKQIKTTDAAISPMFNLAQYLQWSLPAQNATTGIGQTIYILDGVRIQIPITLKYPSSELILSLINPTDIESVTILRDPSSTALYGLQGSGSVVLITTKQARAHTQQLGIQTQLTFNRDKDFIHRHHLHVAGGKRVRYYAGAGYDTDLSTDQGTPYQRIATHLSLEGTLTKRINLGLQVHWLTSMISSKLYHQDQEIALSFRQSVGQGSLYMTYQIRPHLRLRSSLTLTPTTIRNESSETQQRMDLDNNGNLIPSIYKILGNNNIGWNTWIQTNTLDYEKLFSTGRLNLLAGTEWQYQSTHQVTDGTILTSNSSSTQNNVNVRLNETATLSRFSNMFIQTSYIYRERLGIQSNLSLSKQEQEYFGHTSSSDRTPFYSVSGFWRPATLSFLQKWTWLQDWKIRASHGKINYHQAHTRSTLSTQDANVSTFYPINTAIASNIGTDLSFWHNRLTISIDRYWSKATVNYLDNFRWSTILTSWKRQVNINEKGTELHIQAQAIQQPNLRWQTGIHLHRFTQMHVFSSTNTDTDTPYLGIGLNPPLLRSTSPTYNPKPNFIGSWTNAITWHRLSIQCLLSGSIGGTVINREYNLLTPFLPQPPTPKVVSASWLRLQTLAVQYPLQSNWLKKVLIKQASIYCTASNLAFWSKAQEKTIEQEQEVLPIAKRYALGIQLLF